MKSSDKKALIIVLIIGGLVFAIGNMVTEKVKEKQTTKNEIEIPESLITELKESGLLYKVNPNVNEAYVSSAVWNSLTVDKKEIISKALAFYCGSRKGTNLNWVDIRDKYSAKRLAKYSESYGFSIDND